MSSQEISPERFAQLFHDYHHALAHESGDETAAPSSSWSEIPVTEQVRIIAAARLALLEVELVRDERASRHYFAKPGEAEWGC
jgi:hypothetical protein